MSLLKVAFHNTHRIRHAVRLDKLGHAGTRYSVQTGHGAFSDPPLAHRRCQCKEDVRRKLKLGKPFAAVYNVFRDGTDAGVVKHEGGG